MELNFDVIKTLLDVGLGAVALVYARRLGLLLENHETRLTKLEHA